MQMLKNWYTSKQDVPDRDIIPYMGLIDVFYPRICVGCSRQGEYICGECRKHLLKPEEKCPGCLRRSPGGWRHKECLGKSSIDRLSSGLTYRGAVQKCLKKVKYKSAWEIVEFLCQIAEFPRMAGWTVTAVPMYPPKERRRGFNQAEMLARLIAQKQGAEWESMLMRIRETKPMYGLSSEERRQNVEGAFRLIGERGQVRGRQVVIVDDVWTTGSTLEECARILKEAGAAKVWGVTLAR